MNMVKVVVRLEFEVTPESQDVPLEMLLDALDVHARRFPFRFVQFTAQWGTATLNLTSATVEQRREMTYGTSSRVQARPAEA